MTGVSVAHDVVGLARALRATGVPVSIEQMESFARALTFIDATNRREVFLAGRTSLVTRREDMPLFDAVFAAFWSSKAAASRGGRGPRPARTPDASPTAFAAYMAEKARRDDPEVRLPEEAKAASSEEKLQHKDFADLTDDELAAVQRLISELRFEPAWRRTRRFVASRRGRTLDLRRALRAASRFGGVLPSVPRRRRSIKRRPIVVLADISGSMELYSRILLQFFHGLTRVHRLTETFVFGTRLTCVTSQLQIRRVDEALRHASAAIVDFAGGTRIGESLRAFNHLHAGRVLRRGAVLLIVSDGWETGDPECLRTEMVRLKRRCHRLVWLNPLLGRSTYRPTAAGMAIALAHVHDFLPIHDLQSLKDLSDHLARLDMRRASQPFASRSREEPLSP